eukprot:TRINITY_DN21259_c0_g1_i1.p1 TRINITY_DN21259_c0_g1~~TRINITY_DN21259_c0_g1_i1.p1  ORF type:complete len:279 (+),score=54.38 TRINITY_DN21259_c0_g1_i1:592-1428(+)
MLDPEAAAHVSVVDPGSRVMIVGDIHGCCDEFRQLLKKHHRRTDTLILAGDLVNKGPKSVQVVQLAREMGALAVLGNHEVATLRAWQSRCGGKHPEQHPRYAWTDELLPEDVDYLRRLPYTIRLPAHNALVVHAGLVPGVLLEEQRPNDMVMMRDLESSATGLRASEKPVGQPWAGVWDGPEHVYFGHDAKRRLQKCEFATGLDTGCLYGGQLTAAILEVGQPRKIVSVPAQQQYIVPGVMPVLGSASRGCQLPLWRVVGIGCGVVGLCFTLHRFRKH